MADLFNWNEMELRLKEELLSGPVEAGFSGRTCFPLLADVSTENLVWCLCRAIWFDCGEIYYKREGNRWRVGYYETTPF